MGKNEVFKATSSNTYRIVESAELVMKTSEFLGCHEHDVNSLTWPLYRVKSTTVSKWGQGRRKAMHVNDGPRMFHVTNVRVTLDVSGPTRPSQLKGNPYTKTRCLLFFAVSVVQPCLDRASDTEKPLTII